MAITKNAFIRYQTLDRCFRNTGRLYVIDDLLKACNAALTELDPGNNGIRKRQLYDDIRFMTSEQGWSIELDKIRCGRKIAYRYLDPSFSIRNEPLNEAETTQIKAALQIISRFSGAPQFEWVNEMIPKMESKFGLIAQENEIISFESNVDLKGRHRLQPLFQAIINQRVLSVTYRDFKSEFSYQLVFHPYYLKQFNNRWFCLGLNAENKNPTWNLALDRIERLEETELSYRPTAIDWADYFYDLIGVSRLDEAALTQVELLFDAAVAPYVLTKPLHPSQKSYPTAEGLLVKLKLYPNFELEKRLLSFGEQVQVVAPNDLRIKLQSRLTKALKHYTKA